MKHHVSLNNQQTFLNNTTYWRDETNWDQVERDKTDKP